LSEIKVGIGFLLLLVLLELLLEVLLLLLGEECFVLIRCFFGVCILSLRLFLELLPLVELLLVEHELVVFLLFKFVLKVVLLFRFVLLSRLGVGLDFFLLLLVVVGSLNALDVNRLFKVVHLFQVHCLKRLVLHRHASLIRVLVPVLP
jgi:hypothetical protein